ncbi:MAG: hypothetical protein ABR974_08535 [Bacteroidales bacterium]|jgi:hypothetical protein
MKKLLIPLILVTIPLLRVTGQSIPDNDLRLMDNYINSKTTVEKQRIESDTLKKVFRGSFYSITPTFDHNNGKTTCDAFRIVIADGKISELEELSENKTLGFLFSLLQKGVAIRNESDAKTFQAAIDQIYPLSWSVKAEDKKHLKLNDKWLFLRGDFFGSKEGLVVTLDQNSVISKIDFDLEAIKKK